MKILIVEDEPKTVAYLRKGLTEQGYAVDFASNGEDGLHLAQTLDYDAVVLDGMLPGLDGVEVLGQLRQTRQTPVIMLTARDSVEDRLMGLGAGADDYLVKPFSFLELLARLQAITRRGRSESTTITVGDLHLDLMARRATRAGKRLNLTAKEFALLVVLGRRQSQIVSKTIITELVWDINFDTNTNVVEVAIKRLRAKIDGMFETKLLHTVRGMGYVLEHRPEGEFDMIAAPKSIAGRLALMFAIATGLVSILAGVMLFSFQSLELKRHQAEELSARSEIIEAMIRRLEDPTRWPLMTDKLKSFTPADGSIRYRIESADPRFQFMPGKALEPARNGVGVIHADGKRFMTLSRTVPAYGRRPDVRLVIAADTAPFDASRYVLGVGALGMSALITALVSLLGWWIARRGLAPVDRLSQRAGTLNPADLSLRMPTQDLPAELVGLMSAFNGALDRLQAAYERLAAFNADVAHELRTPLGNLIGQTQVALSRTRDADELEDTLHSNLEELERLRTIINDMLFMARADQGALVANLAPLSLAALTHKTADFLDVLFEDAEVRLEVRGDASVTADASLLGRAVTNLLDNAIRHGVDCKTVRVTIETQDKAVCLSVRNKGGPIPEPHLARLFDRFYRMDRAREHSGEVHGLGLAVVKAIVIMHGGSVFARCEGGEVLIGFLLPRVEPVATDGGPASAAAVPPPEREAVDA